MANCFRLSAPKLKGRPRKRKKPRTRGCLTGLAAQLPSGKTASAGGGGAGSDSDGGSDSSESSATAGPVFKNGGSLKQGSREALSAGSLALRHTKEEAEFLKKLVDFMDKRGTPIDRLPMIGVMPGKGWLL